MDVDHPSASASAAAAAASSSSGAITSAKNRTIAVHPLSIVSMADQYTRIVTGGSPLHVNEPVVGLLFGTHDPKTNVLRVTDAEDAPVNLSDAASAQISLHQAVFTHHSVVGWYRVSSADASPTPEDLILSQQLAHHYCLHPSSSVHDSSGISSSSDVPFLFALLQVKSSEQESKEHYEHGGDEDDELPFSLFAVDLQRQVLVGLDDAWTLETAVAERIAVERVMRERPVAQQSKENNNNNAVRTSPFVVATANLQHSVAAMQERVAVLEHFLEATAAGTVPYDHDLLRHIRGLLLHSRAVNAGITSNNDTTAIATSTSTSTTGVSPTPTTAAATPGGDGSAASLLLQQLAVLAKTVQAVQQYTDRARALHESSGSSSSSAARTAAAGTRGGLIFGGTSAFQK